MENPDIRWIQRFDNFEKSFKQLEDSLKREEYSLLEKAGVIQFYEITFELAWKTLKDYLEANNVVNKFPRDTIKSAFKYELIEDGELWLEMLEKRNIISHTYDEITSEKIFELIKNLYFFEIEKVYLKLKSLK